MFSICCVCYHVPFDIAGYIGEQLLVGGRRRVGRGLAQRGGGVVPQHCRAPAAPRRGHASGRRPSPRDVASDASVGQPDPRDCRTVRPSRATA